MRSEHRIELPDGRTLDAMVAVPAGAAPAGGWPGVLVVHEAPVLTEPIREVADVFASRGWVAVVPNLLSSGSAVGCLVRNMREVTSGKPGQVTDDLHAVQSWLRARADVDGERTAVIGFCMGGAFALLLGSLAPDGLRAVADNYGLLPADDTDLRSCPPVVASFGKQDSIVRDGAATLTKRLDDAGVVADVVEYDGAKHSFLTRDAPFFGFVTFPGTKYIRDVAEPAWERIFAFLEQHTGVTAAD